MRNTLTALALASLLALPAMAAIDGSIVGDGYDMWSVQTVQTNFGDNASELDAAWGSVAGGYLNLALTGNLEANFNKIEIFIDSKAGGQNTLNGVPGNDGTGVMSGLTFDDGFSADYHIILRRGSYEGDKFDLDIAALNTANYSSYSDLFGGALEGSGTTGTGAGNATPIEVAYSNANTAGVAGGTAAADQAAAAAVETGVELKIALSDLGSPAGDFKIMAFVNGSNHDYASNQFLGGLNPPQDNLGGDGYGNWNGSLAFDLGDFACNQYFCTPEPGSLSLLVFAGLLALRRR